jgi:ADP-heptose:LPS heptosyltransferase
VSSATSGPLAALAPRRVAILRALMLGDLLCAVPALRALRAGLPEAEIVLVGLGWARAFAERFDRYVDGFLELPGFPGLAEIEPRVPELPAFLARAHELRLDLAVQLHGSGAITNPLAVLLGARRTAGFYLPGSFRPDDELFVPYPDKGHEIHRLLRLPEALGLPLRGDELELPLGPEDHEELARAAPGLAGTAYACVHPGARLADRRWPPERFAAVADALADRGLHVVLTGTQGERPLTEAVARAATAPVHDLTGATSLGALGALVAGARLVVSNDTGVAHVAAALRAPSVVVVTASDPERWAPLDRELHRVVVRPEGPDAVLGEADSLLAATSPAVA